METLGKIRESLTDRCTVNLATPYPRHKSQLCNCKHPMLFCRIIRLLMVVQVQDFTRWGKWYVWRVFWNDPLWVWNRMTNRWIECVLVIPVNATPRNISLRQYMNYQDFVLSWEVRKVNKSADGTVGLKLKFEERGLSEHSKIVEVWSTPTSLLKFIDDRISNGYSIVK